MARAGAPGINRDGGFGDCGAPVFDHVLLLIVYDGDVAVSLADSDPGPVSRLAEGSSLAVEH